MILEFERMKQASQANGGGPDGFLDLSETEASRLCEAVALEDGPALMDLLNAIDPDIVGMGYCLTKDGKLWIKAIGPDGIIKCVDSECAGPLGFVEASVGYKAFPNIMTLREHDVAVLNGYRAPRIYCCVSIFHERGRSRPWAIFLWGGQINQTAVGCPPHDMVHSLDVEIG